MATHPTFRIAVEILRHSDKVGIGRACQSSKYRFKEIAAGGEKYSVQLVARKGIAAMVDDRFHE